MGKIRIGVSGWDYSGWQGGFYPESLPRSRRLGYVAECFDTVEANGTFYSLLTPSTFRRWRDSVPSDFVFALKGSRFITHNKKLSDVEGALANFFASGILELDTALGPILWQLSEHLHFDPARIGGFLELLPHDTQAASALARHHDDRIDDVSYGSGENHRVRHVLEVRHRSFLDAEMVRLARDNGVALAFSHSSRWPYLEEITAGFVYLRLHGPGELYASPYGDESLRRWAERLSLWQQAEEPDDARRITDRVPPRRSSRDVYVSFDNDEGGHAPREAARLSELLQERRAVNGCHGGGPGVPS